MAVNQNDVIRADAIMELPTGTQLMNVFQVQYTGVASLDEAVVFDDIAEILERVFSILAALLNLAHTFERIRMVNLTQNSDVGDGGWPTLTAGTSVGSRMPQQVAAAITYRTADLGVVGRKFFGPMTESEYDINGAFTAGTITALTGAAAQMIVDQLVGLRPYRFGVIRTFDGVFLPFESASLSTYAGTQRRRRVNVGT